AMQPPPRTGPPGASGPPPSGPNMFRRTRPYKHTTAATATVPPATQPMTDPFAFVRAPPPVAAGGLPTIPNSNPPPMQAPLNSMYSQPGGGLPPQPHTMDVPAAPLGAPPSSLSGVTLFNPHSTASPGGYTSAHTEQGYFSSREQTSSMALEPLPVASALAPSQTPFNQEFQGQPPPQSGSFQPVPPTTSSSQWAPDHGSRPPSVQNYFQPTSDPPPQPFNIHPQPQMYPSHTPSPHHNIPTPPTQPGHPQMPASLSPQTPIKASSSQFSNPNASQQHNSHFQTESYFSQSSAPHDSLFSQPPQDSGYHQMGAGLGHLQPMPDFAESQHRSNMEPGPSTAPEPVPYSQESSALSMFFKDDVENEETLAGERNKAVNGIHGSFQHHNNTQAYSSHADVPLDYQGTSVRDGSHASQGNTHRPHDSQYDLVENLECVPNQEVLPSETHGSPAATADHAVDQFETGPNLETPDSVPRPMRSASVSSNYSNMSHGSGTGTRRHQGVVGTFIQQESPRLIDDANPPAATGGYFEQIDSFPAGVMGARQSSLEQMLPPTPSPPKPTGIFQASANSSFEPVRSHGVGVRPAEVDMANIVAEGATDSTPGNLEQPPDNMENIYGPGHPLLAGAGVGVPHLTHPVVHSHSRPSSRSYGANQPCESPATTLWAQNDPASLGTNILLAPAAPTVLAPLREPSADVIQPPEDGPLDLQPPQRVQPTAQQHSENLENPPKVSEAEQTDSQGSLGYASLLVSESLHQPVLIAPPVSNCSVIPPGAPPQAVSQVSLLETTPPQGSQGQGANTSQPHSVTSNLNPLFAPAPLNFSSSVSNQGPLNLTRDNTDASKSEMTAPLQTRPVHPPLSRGQSLGGDSHSAPQVIPPASLVTATVSNHNQPSNYELLDFSMHQSQTQNPASGHPSSLHEPPQSSNGFYLQVTKDAQQGQRMEGNAPVQTPASSSTPQVLSAPSQTAANTQPTPTEPPKSSDSQRSLQGQGDAPPVPVSGTQPSRGQYPTPAQGPATGSQTNRVILDLQTLYTHRREGYDDQWRYYPGYDPSFDDEYQRNEGDEFDRRSVHSEQSAHSVHSSHSHHSRRSSFSSRSQQVRGFAFMHNLKTYSLLFFLLAPPRPVTPEKFTIPHRCARFGPGGHLVQVLPNLPSAGQPALVDIYNMETMLQDTRDQAELRAFPGPLVKEETHKVDVIKFSQNKALECSRDNNLLDRDSARLLWDFIMLLCRQNGTVVGTDIADLLLKEHRSVWLPGKSPNEANLIDFNNEPLARAEEEPGAGPLSLLSDTFMTVPENVGKETERFRELLLFGRKKDALEAAMKGGLWGHALLLASKMDNRTHARVMTRFANSLPINDPLQTVYQLMSGRMPASATCCGEEKWGDWRPHLAMVLSNLTHTLDLDTRTITTMGDTLASKGLIDAAHFCYLMAQVGLGVFTKKSTKMVLIGSNHSLPFYQFATNEAIQRTEAYEYAQSLGSQPCSLPNFQVFKLIYACRLAEAGLCAQAFHYCEVISRTVLVQPSYYSPVFINQIIQVSTYSLRFFDPQLKEKPEQELFNEPEWLIHLRQLDGQIRTGVITYNADRTTPTQFDCSTPSSELDEPSPPEPYNMPVKADGPTSNNPLMSSLLPGPPPQGIQLMPPGVCLSLHSYFSSGNSDMYPGANQQQCAPPSQIGQMSPHMPPQVPHSPVQMNHPPQHMPQHMPPSPGHVPLANQPFQAPPEMQTAQQIPSSPTRGSLTPQMDFYDQMAYMGSGRRSRTTSQSSVHMVPGRRSRTTSESSTHSGGRERSNSAIKQASPPPPSIPEQPRKEEAKKAKKDSPKKVLVSAIFPFLHVKGKNEAHLPDDKNKSIVWDEKKQRWVDLNEPEEESKPPPPPPSGFPKMAPMPVPGGSAPPMSSGPPVNMFSRKAGKMRCRYVDVLNPSRAAKPGGLAPAPVDIFAPLAPMPMPANLFVPSSGMFNPTLLPPAPEGPPVPDGSQSGEVLLL
uniref:Protein transport protein sec16 n=1 Tax=Anabas testudineus TaxID=64144 RepID=A0A7N6BNH2_ANATE